MSGHIYTTLPTILLRPHTLTILAGDKPSGLHSPVKWATIPVDLIEFLHIMTLLAFFGFQGCKIKKLLFICSRNLYSLDLIGSATQSCKILRRNKYKRIRRRQNWIIMGKFVANQGSYPTYELNIRPI